MRILYCASEANPLCGSGGLARAAGNLPHTLFSLSLNRSIVGPRYGTIQTGSRNSLNFNKKFNRPVLNKVVKF